MRFLSAVGSGSSSAHVRHFEFYKRSSTLDSFFEFRSRITMMKVVQVLVLVFLSLDSIESQRKTNCGFKCFRWERCMQQLAGNENRPHQLGDTGQIVLTKCDMGNCDCNQVLKEETTPRSTRTGSQISREKQKTRSSSFTPSIRRPLTNRSPSSDSESSSRRPLRNLTRPRTLLLKTTTTTTTPRPSADSQKVKFTDDSGRVRFGVVTGTSVSSSVSVSSSSDHDEQAKQRLTNNLDPKELLRHRLRLYAQKRRFYY